MERGHNRRETKDVLAQGRIPSRFSCSDASNIWFPEYCDWSSPNEYGLEKRNTNQNNYGLRPILVYMRKMQDTMANEMDTNRIMWNTNGGKRLPDLTGMNQQVLVAEVTARAVNDTIESIVNENATASKTSEWVITESQSQTAAPYVRRARH